MKKEKWSLSNLNYRDVVWGSVDKCAGAVRHSALRRLLRFPEKIDMISVDAVPVL